MHTLLNQILSDSTFRQYFLHQTYFFYIPSKTFY